VIKTGWWVHYVPLVALAAAGLLLRSSPATAIAISGYAGSASGDLPAPGRLLYVTNSAMDGGAPTIGVFTINAAGNLTPLGDPVRTDGGLRGMVFTPGLRNAYAVDLAANRIRMYRIGPDGRLSGFGEIATGNEPFGIAITPNGRTVYVANIADSTVSTFAVRADGGLTPRGAVLSGAKGPQGLAVTPDGHFLYVSHGGAEGAMSDMIIGFAIQPDGTLQRQGAPTPIGAVGIASAVTPDGRFLYVVCRRSDQMFGFRIGSDGSLTPVPGTPLNTADFGEGAAMSPDGRLLAVIALGVPGKSAGQVLTYAIGDDGTLTQTGSPVEMKGEPVGATFAPNGQHLYVSNLTENTVTTFTVDRAGGLIPTQTLSSGGQQPAFHSVNMLPSRHPIASFSAPAGPVDDPIRFDASTSSDLDGRVVRYDWDFGDGTTLPDGGPTPQHQYRAVGRYQARLTVTDDEGCSTGLVYTGQSALCLGAPDATTSRVVIVN
jgi:6-phosphogluconolactonase (cycloisomerase 2 family)